jgi:2-methylisocitrate lyase-like PEP mutase family enzyme
MTATSTPAAKLRQMLNSDGLIVAPFVMNGLHARIAESVGFNAVYMTGAGTAAERGFPDVGWLTMTEMVANAKYIANAVDIPVVCDADTGYGNALNVRRTVREYEDAGVAGIHIEDQVFPKKCGFFEGKQVVPMEEHVQKILSALDARRDPDFVIIARCDAYAVTGWEDTIERCNAYVEAGADLVFVDGIKSEADIQNYARDMAGLPRMYNGDLMNTKDIDALGYKLMICGSTIWLIYKQVRAAYEELIADGMVNPDRYGTRWDVAQVLGLDAIYELEKKYGVQDVGTDVAALAAAQAAQMAADAAVPTPADD